MRLHRMLDIQKGLPPDSLYDMLFARKTAENRTESAVTTGYPCILEKSTGKLLSLIRFVETSHVRQKKRQIICGICH